MKKDKDKCKKGKESTIGKIIYGFLLFLPLMAIGTTCLITTFNMSAKEESEIIYKYKTNNIINESDLIENNIYHFEYNFTDTAGQFLRCKSIYNINDTLNTSISIENTTYQYLYIYRDNNTSIWVAGHQENGTNTNISRLILNTSILTADIVYYNNYGNLSYTVFSYCSNIPIKKVDTHNVNTQDVFYTAINKVTESPLFNWVENSVIYTGMTEFTTSLSITNTFIPLLLTYWLIISLVYFIYDIVLIIFNILHRKIHELQDSI